MLERLKTKWGIKSDFQLIIIFIVFGITGSASAKLALPVLDLIGVYPQDFNDIPLGKALYLILRILVIFPIYQMLLIVVATLFFQFKFFWAFEKRFLKKIGLGFIFRKNEKN